MDDQLVAGSVLVLAGLAGLIGAPLDFPGSQDSSAHVNEGSGQSHEKLPGQGAGHNYTLGSSHEHALFYLNINGTEENFTARRYQLNSPFVHLENFRPHIVHKHSENVTWSYFLDTINVEVRENCVRFKGIKRCGNVSAVLNGEEVDSLKKEIQQGDNLAVIVPPESSLRQKYMEKSLPTDYTRKAKGRTV